MNTPVSLKERVVFLTSTIGFKVDTAVRKERPADLRSFYVREQVTTNALYETLGDVAERESGSLPSFGRRKITDEQADSASECVRVQDRLSFDGGRASGKRGFNPEGECLHH